MNDPDKIRRKVARSYAQAAARSSSTCCNLPAASTCVVTRLAGYRPEELEALPAEVAACSFGCGNPLAFGQVAPGDVVLDLGCGAGVDLLIAAGRVGPSGRAIGVDMTDEMLARAQRNIARSGLTNVELRKGIIEDLPVDASSVDWVISNCVINLSPNKPKVFAEIARVLRPGGRMVIWDIVAWDLPDWVRQSEALYDSCVAGAISEAEYIAGLRQAGLEEVEVRERIVYDPAQLAEFTQSELSGSGQACGCGQAGPEDATARQIGLSLAGKVWSACFLARKPA